MLLSATECSGKGNNIKRPQLELARQIVQVQMSAMKADMALLEDMQTVSQALLRFHKAHRRFPDSGAESYNLALKLSRLLPNNPYFTDPALANCLKQEGHSGEGNRPCVSISSDIFLSHFKLPDLLAAPPDTWHASPGTISIIHNNEDTFVVWGAGASGAAIKDAASGRTQIIMRQINR